MRDLRDVAVEYDNLCVLVSWLYFDTPEADTWMELLTEKQREAFEEAISRGQFHDWKDVIYL